LSDLSTCIELLILTFDIIDDLQDLDNKEAVWSKMKQSSAINSSICIFTLLLLKLLEKGEGNIIHNMLTFLLKSIEGQHQDINAKYTILNNI
jgi:competence protein ComQ